MKLQFRQRSAGWCTVYTLANIFKDDRFLKFTEEERFKGCGKDEVDFMLNDLGYGMQLGQVMYVNQNYKALPKGYLYSCLRLLKEQVSDDIEVKVPVVPYLLSVRLIPTMWHSVAVLMIGDNMYYIDPYKEEMLHIETFEQFDILFIDCMMVERPFRIQDSRFIILLGEELGYGHLAENNFIC
jgi:hypothetical protein